MPKPIEDDNQETTLSRALKNVPRHFGENYALQKVGEKMSDLSALARVAQSRVGKMAPTLVKQLGGAAFKAGRFAASAGKFGRSPLGLATEFASEMAVDVIPQELAKQKWEKQHPWVSQGLNQKEYDALRSGLKVDFVSGKVFDPKTGEYKGKILDPWSKTEYTPKLKRDAMWTDSAEQHYQKPFTKSKYW